MDVAMNDRIKLAEDRIRLSEAMGWTYLGLVALDGDGSPRLWKHPSDDLRQNRLQDDLPDPFTDANDDYAVLEFMRALVKADYDNNCELWENFHPELPHITDYQIGDYARAALKVIDD
jgi:hypothetical protein